MLVWGEANWGEAVWSTLGLDVPISDGLGVLVLVCALTGVAFLLLRRHAVAAPIDAANLEKPSHERRKRDES